MWNWEQERRREHRDGPAQLGRVTLTGDQTGADLGGERRWLAVCAPGGYRWCPAEGEQVLVLKTEGGGEIPCVLGVVGQPEGLLPGQVGLQGSKCALLLGDQIALTGDVTLNGEPLADYIRRICGEGAGD